MYAVIETGGKQYRVEVGTELEVELLDVEPGQTITLERVLLVADGDDATDRPPGRRGRAGQRRGRPPGSGREDDHLQVPAQGAPPRQEGPSPGADGPPHQRHRARRQERGQGPPRRPRTPPGPSASASRRPPRRQAAQDTALAAKLAAAASAAKAEAEGRRSPTRRPPRRRPPSRAPRRRRRQGRRDGQAARRQRRRRKADSTDEGGQGRPRRRRPTPRRRAAHARRTSRPDGTQEGRRQRQERPRQRRPAARRQGRRRPARHAGSIIVRQRGMTFLAGPGTGLGHDYTVFATITGKRQVRARHQEQEAHPGRAVERPPQHLPESATGHARRAGDTS